MKGRLRRNRWGIGIMIWNQTLAAGGTLAFVISLSMSIAIIWLSRRYPRLAGRPNDLSSVQSMHVRLTPRVGGFGVFLAVLVALPYTATLSEAPVWALSACAAVLFLTGLAEDLGWHVSPSGRLLAAAVSTALVIGFLGIWVPRVGLTHVDELMANGLLGIPLTLIAVVGLANAFNLVDGVHGLAATAAIFAVIGMGAIALQAGYDEILPLLAILLLAIAGFLLINFPFGLIFLGDAGAYTLGFLIAWFGIAIISGAEHVSPWAILLTVFWPIMDTLLAIYRRSIRKKNTMQPDRLHVHQLVLRSLQITIFGRNQRQIANPLTTVVLSPFAAGPVVLGISLWNNVALSFFAFFGMIAAYFTGYFILSKLVRNGTLKRATAQLSRKRESSQVAAGPAE